MIKTDKYKNKEACHIKAAVLGGGIGGTMAALDLSEKFPHLSIRILKTIKNYYWEQAIAHLREWALDSTMFIQAQL